MDAFFTNPFMQNFPGNLKHSMFIGNSAFYDLFMAMKTGRLKSGTDEGVYLKLLEDLKINESELYQVFMSLYDSGKVQCCKVTSKEIPIELKEVTMRKSVLKEIGKAYLQNPDSVYHDGFEQSEWKEQLMAAGGTPIIDEDDLQKGKIEYLFIEKSYPLNLHDEFNWARFLADFMFPFKKVRILDPYMYVNIQNVDIKGMIKTITRKCGDNIEIEIISDLSANNKWKPEVLLKKVEKELEPLGGLRGNIKLFTQKGSAGNLFHKRVVWTDFWVINAERGFDFLKLNTGKGTVTKENTLFMSGKYSSKESLWHQIGENWTDYLNLSREVSGI